MPTVSCMVRNVYSRKKTKRGPPTSLKKHDELRIKREIFVLEKRNKRVMALKLKINLSLDVTKRALQRKLKQMTYSYQTVSKKILLTVAQKKLRVKLAHEWIANGHPWQQSVFSDEKRFSFDGTDNRSLGYMMLMNTTE